MRVPRFRSFAVVGAMSGLMIVTLPSAAYAVDLGTAESFAVLAGSTVTNTGPSTINGNIGLSPGSEVVLVQPPATVNGTINVNNGLANGAKGALTRAFNEAASRPSTASVSQDLAADPTPLIPGVYTASSSMGLNGTLTLDAQGDEDAEFVFQAGSTLITGPGASVNLIGGAQACNIFWQVGTSATVGTGTSFVGTIMADQSVTMETGATIRGRALASVGAVTLDTNVFTRPECATNDDDDGDDDGGDDDSGDDDGGTTPGPNPGPRDGQNTQPNSSGPQGGSNDSGDDTSTDDDSSDDLVTVTESGSAPPVVPSGNPDTGLGGASDSSVGAGWLAAGFLALGGAAAAGIYGYRPLRPARVRRR